MDHQETVGFDERPPLDQACREADGVTSQTAGIYDLTADGAQMFVNAVQYMAVPEPSTAILIMLGIMGLAMRRRNR